MDLAEGMDHALACDSSKSPRKDHHVEGAVPVRKSLRRADGKASVTRTGTARAVLRAGDAFGVGVETLHVSRERRDADGEPAVAAP